MEKLTLKKAVDEKFRPIDCVRYYFPDMSDEEADMILWERTCYPFDSEYMLDQLYDLFTTKT